MRYRALLFDLFNTVAVWRPERMPTFTIAGRARPSTLGELARVLADRVPDLPFERFHEALDQTNAALYEERALDGREVPSSERFARALRRAGLADDDATVAHARALSARHMELLAGASDIPRAHVAFLSQLTASYPLALVSNFDHAPTARAIVERDGAGEVFHHVVISDEFGWRKPDARIFEHALAALGAAPDEALFVGDSLEDDVCGAHAAGIDVAWVNPAAKPLPDDVPRPDYTVDAITDLASVLG